MHLLRVLIYCYLSLVVLWGVAWYLRGDANWVMYCLNRSAAFLYIPGIVLPLVLVVASRQYLVTLLSLLPLILFISIFHQQIFPKHGDERSNDLRVMTYNILCSNRNLIDVAQMVRKELPQLIAFQEMTENQFSRLSELLGDEYPYRHISYQVPCGSTAVFSQLPVTEFRIINLKSDRPAMLTTVERNDKSIIFVSAHLLPMYSARIRPLNEIPSAINDFIDDKTRQVSILIENLESFESDLVIIGCDCNTLMTHSTYRALSDKFVDSATVVGKPDFASRATKNSNPYQLDYVFYRGRLRPTANYRLVDSAGSDHLPVMAHFSL